MIVLVCGGRDFGHFRPEKDRNLSIQEWEFVFNTLTKLSKDWPGYFDQVKIISGAATGVDTVAKDWALDKGLDYTPYPAKWRLYGKKAGHIRNAQMLKEEDVDRVIAFPGGPGTADMVYKAEKAGIPVDHIDITKFQLWCQRQ